MADDRDNLLRQIDREMRETASLTGRERLSDRVRGALGRVPREDFVPEAERSYAYVNHPLPIGHGQTISQPFIVAIMTELLEPGPTHRVLEVGTGSGYQTAVLAELAGQVFSVEVVPELAEAAPAKLARYANVSTRLGDGWEGWPEQAPFERIIVTAAAAEMPAALLDQVAPGGRMVIPIGRPYGEQVLKVVCKRPDGAIEEEDVLPVAFVPMVHGRPADGV